MKKRWIAHVDMDAFFANVEIERDSSLKGKPVVVGGNPNSRGVVCSASYEARKYGIRSGMPLFKAKELCPSAIFLKPRFSLYREYSEKIHKILKKYAPVVEKASIDEYYLDLTGCEKLYGDICTFTLSLKKIISRKTGLPCSIGLGSNKFIAKTASKRAKPDGFLYIPHGEEISFLSPLPIGEMIGIGKNMERRLQEMGIKTIGDIIKFPLSFLINSFGRFGEYLWEKARGIDFEEVKNCSYRKSLSHEMTFTKDSEDKNFLRKILAHLVENLCFRLREENLRTGTITLKIRYSDFKTVTISRTIEPTNCDTKIYKVAKELLEKAYTRRIRVRLLGLKFSKLLEENFSSSLFQDKEKKENALFKGIDLIRKKFGNIIHLGSFLS
ncbi:DNA polymerase IV [Candidatus Aminicenantes bacterium AC-708-M15]|jgi:DNA polymerase-4|nr:DNA polymerase IV [SCandidatus Aminicenantes bacterium Aminicenantia_JdfR_composite]MCP2597141.1 DNA polymerase IV [Candidatus Aminicenantes bacterium AC-335-G13]MCP2604298.1 DNA polymerase IV [Candidatus Aminicenantes bacterium AC-708-M15]MCP2617990.1 DNA polymerase IV [Candidatus Aminicenantes bacterium AC-335-A11]MCP2619464.1 DNA polymerase IV [Candidatus Aminicenantes bacterium AC-335-K20]MCP2620706.1 DNA polymerase IV [Candidatus Aminicenantes bacterium AC-334-E05]